jgi:glyoxylase-like metal-dependent hydrolase (beta-lactamase superfamily II)
MFIAGNPNSKDRNSARAGMFERIPVPTPFEIGRINAYVAGRTVVDPGPNSEKSWNELVEGLAELGLEPADVEQVLITHPHIDHFGLGKRFRDLGADIVASPQTANIVEDYAGRVYYQQKYFGPYLQRCGMAKDLAETIVQLPEAFVQYASDFETDVVVEDGDTVTVADRTLDVIGAGGHAPGEIVFAYDEGDERHALVADNVLGHVTPNPFLEPPEELDGERPTALLNYNASLRRLREEDFDLLLPGHGDLIDNPNERISEVLDANEQRTAEVKEIVSEPIQPVDVMEELFGDMPVTEQFLCMSEAIGHLDVLEDRDEAICEDDGQEIVYRPAE